MAASKFNMPKWVRNAPTFRDAQNRLYSIFKGPPVNGVYRGNGITVELKDHKPFVSLTIVCDPSAAIGHEFQRIYTAVTDRPYPGFPVDCSSMEAFPPEFFQGL